MYFQFCAASGIFIITQVGTLVNHKATILLVGQSDRIGESLQRLARIGYSNVSVHTRAHTRTHTRTHAYTCTHTHAHNLNNNNNNNTGRMEEVNE